MIAKGTRGLEKALSDETGKYRGLKRLGASAAARDVSEIGA
jgi:hypothetical protein